MRAAILLTLLLLVGTVLAQESVPALGRASDKGQRLFDQRPSSTSVVPDRGEQDLRPHTMVEEAPSFPGGMSELDKFLQAHVQYPELARKEFIYGVVYVSFMVEVDGAISEAKILRGIGGGCDEEALRVVEAMPKWSPSKQDGEAVRMQLNLPIEFKLR